MTAPFNALDRFTALSTRTRIWLFIGLIVVAYFVALVITGPHGYIHRRAPIGFLLVGVVYGSVNALGAMGLILVYRANRFINFAHGAMGSIIGVLTIGLVKVHGLDYWIAFPFAVIAGGLLGALIEVGVIRRFSNAPRLIILVASVGLGQVLGGLELIGSKKEHFTAFEGVFAPPFNVSVTIDVYTFHSAEILAVLAVPGSYSSVPAWFLLKHRRRHRGAGRPRRTSDRAQLLGVPVRRLATIVWIIAGALAVLTYMLSAPFEGVKPGVATNGPDSAGADVGGRHRGLAWSLSRWHRRRLSRSASWRRSVRWNTTGETRPHGSIYMGVIIFALLVQSGKLSRAQESGTSSWSAIKVLKPIP